MVSWNSVTNDQFEFVDKKKQAFKWTNEFVGWWNGCKIYSGNYKLKKKKKVNKWK